jgi:OmpA-OmpF porin, OOP family
MILKTEKYFVVFVLQQFQFILLFVLAGTPHLFSQNLILNADFEKYKYCPPTFNQGGDNLITDWNQANAGTVDYYNVCSKMVGVPKNTFGFQNAHSSNGYIGLVTYTPTKRNYREYLQTKLTKPLEANKIYCVEFFISLGDNAMYVSDGIGVYIGKEKLKSTLETSLNLRPQIKNPEGNFITTMEDWLLISDVYKAVGGEEYLTLGNFNTDKKTKVKRRTIELPAGTAWEHAYYFIDDVSISQVKTKEECSCTAQLFSNQLLNKATITNEFKEIEIKSLLFDFDKWSLSTESERQLTIVSKLMLINPSYVLEVNGHADVLGDEQYNIDISKNRALAVIEFLKQKGVSEKKLKINYFGSTSPTAANETVEGRKQNRRVEFKILQKKYEDFIGN